LNFPALFLAQRNLVGQLEQASRRWAKRTKGFPRLSPQKIHALFRCRKPKQ
jgi:hypothetical protein